MNEPVGMMKVGVKAAGFTLKNQDGADVSLEDFQGEKNVVLYFYPKDETPGCTVEACAFRDAFADFGKLDTVILGVSLDPVESHAEFARHHQLPFTLLSDADADVSKLYGVYVERMLYGQSKWGIERSTFLLDKRGIIRHIWRRVKVEHHAEELLDLIRKELA